MGVALQAASLGPTPTSKDHPRLLFFRLLQAAFAAPSALDALLTEWEVREYALAVLPQRVLQDPLAQGAKRSYMSVPLIASVFLGTALRISSSFGNNRDGTFAPPRRPWEIAPTRPPSCFAGFVLPTGKLSVARRVRQ